MTYGTAAHGAWCGARTYPTRCRYCRRDVFYFECNCGCKVFFSELGGTWPLHRCIAGLIDKHGKEFIEYGIAMQMRKHPASNIKSPVEKRYEDAVRNQHRERKGAGSTWIKKVVPAYGGTFEDAAVVKEIEMKVSVPKRLNMASGSSMGAAFLGELSKSDFGQVTIHAGGLEEKLAASYTAFMPTQTLQALRLERGDLVHVKLASYKAGAIWVWMVKRMDFLVH